MDIGKVLAILVLFIFLLLGLSVMAYNPIAGMIILFMAIIITTLIFEPATGKALLKVFLPVILLLIVLSTIVSAYEKLSFEMMIIITLVVFLLFIGSAAAIGSTELKSAMTLAPLIVIPTFFALLIDPSGKLAIIVTSSIMFGFLALVTYLVKGLKGEYDITLPQRFGVAIEDLSPKGRVKLGGEIWWAFSDRWIIKKGDEVYAIDRDGLELKVVPVFRCPVCGKKYPITNVPEKCLECGTPLSEYLFKEIESKLKVKRPT